MQKKYLAHLLDSIYGVVKGLVCENLFQYKFKEGAMHFVYYTLRNYEDI